MSAAFPASADPDAYVPRQASERALARLAARALASAAPLALTGPPGLGKTLLLRLLARRLAGRLRVVHLPYPALSAEELCAWALAALGEPPSAEPVSGLFERARALARAGTPLLLAVDDAAHLPLDAARRLAVLAALSDGALRLLVAATDGPELAPRLAALGAGCEEVRLEEPLDAAEAAAFLGERLARAAAGRTTRPRLGRRTLAHLHRESAGNPRLLAQLAEELLLRRRRRPLFGRGNAQPGRAGGPAAPRRIARRRAGLAFTGLAAWEIALLVVLGGLFALSLSGLVRALLVDPAPGVPARLERGPTP